MRSLPPNRRPEPGDGVCNAPGMFTTGCRPWRRAPVGGTTFMNGDGSQQAVPESGGGQGAGKPPAPRAGRGRASLPFCGRSRHHRSGAHVRGGVDRLASAAIATTPLRSGISSRRPDLEDGYPVPREPSPGHPLPGAGTSARAARERAPSSRWRSFAPRNQLLIRNNLEKCCRMKRCTEYPGESCWQYLSSIQKPLRPIKTHSCPERSSTSGVNQSQRPGNWVSWRRDGVICDGLE